MVRTFKFFYERDKKIRYTTILVIMVSACLLLTTVSIAENEKNIFAGGSGTRTDPYLIETAEQLDNIRYFLDDHFKQISSIDLGGFYWLPIGVYLEEDNVNNAFRGTYDGAGYVIYNMNMDFNERIGIGLFGYVGEGALLANINLEEVKVVGTYCVGALVGYNQGGTIINSNSQGDISGEESVGGLVGFNEGLIINCSTNARVLDEKQANGFSGTNSHSEISQTSDNLGKVSGIEWVGGLVGFNSAGLIKHSSTSIFVKGERQVGGLVGGNAWEGEIVYSISSGNVTGELWIGGLVGSNSNALINKSYATGSVTGKDEVGGLVGSNLFTATIINSKAFGKVNGESWVGGLVGYNTDGSIFYSAGYGDVYGSEQVGGLVGRNDLNAKIQVSFAEGMIDAQTWVGGLVGYNSNAFIVDTYAHGDVHGNQQVGGLVGRNDDGHILQSYSANRIFAQEWVGGLVGVDHNGLIENCYYNQDTSGQHDTDKGIPKPDQLMKRSNTFSGWDFEDIWYIVESESYPYLNLQ